MADKRGQINDPLQRRPDSSPLRGGASFSSSPNVTFLDPATPHRSSQRGRTTSNTPSDSPSNSSSNRSPRPLIRLNDSDDDAVFDSGSRGDDDDDNDNDKNGMNYGATSDAAGDGQRLRRGNRPDRIRMPPAPYSRTGANDEAVSDTSLLTPGGHSSIASGPARSRQMSFKKRRPSSRSTTDGSNSRAGFLHRASLGVFGRPPNSPSASPRGGPDARARARQLRQVQTLSVHPNEDNAANESSWERKPKIPSMMPSVSAHSTHIPTVPFVVLCLVCFGEFSSAGVAGPFLFFQIDSFDVGGEKEVAKWAGIVSAVFFFAQFLTSLLWSSAAQKHGRRSVLLVSLVGNAVSLILFGMATNLPFAISVRLAQGLFNGAVGVAKGAVRDLTDETNEGRAMAQLGFAWGMGGIVGPLLGGVLCNPVEKYPWLFGNSERFKEYPYLLPCLVVSSFTAIGAFLSLFIGPDGGPRTGAIYLPEKVDVERATARAASNVESFSRSAGKRISGYFGGHNDAADESIVSLTNTNAPDGSRQKNLSRTFTQQVDEETGGPPSPVESDSGTITTAQAGFSGFDQRSLMSKTRVRQHNILEGGSAYGYADLAPGPSTVRERRASMAQSSRLGIGGNMRHSVLSQSQYAPDLEELHAKQQKLSFAQRFLLANDDAVLSLSDLWVAAAINNDGEYEDGEDDNFGYDNYIDEEDEPEDEEEQETLDDSIEGSDQNESTGSRVFGHDDVDEDPLLVPRHLPPVNFARKNRQTSMASSGASRPFSYRGGNRIPSLYNNTGVENNAALLSPGASAVGPIPGLSRQDGPAGTYDPTLAGIPESGSVPGSLRGNNLPGASPGVIDMTEIGDADQSRSLFLQLPLVFIAHYGLMSLHSSTFDQVRAIGNHRSDYACLLLPCRSLWPFLSHQSCRED